MRGFDFETRPIKYWVYTPETAAAAAGGLWSCFCSSAEGDLVLTDRFSGTFADGLNKTTEHRGRCLNNDVSNREDRPQDSRSRFDFNVSVQFPVNVALSCDPRIRYRPDRRWRWVDDLDT